MLRSNWDQSELQSVATIEDGDRIAVAGLLLDAKPSVAETCNCSYPDSAWRDFHIWIAGDKPNADASKSFVVEITPRVRAQHPGWTLKKLRSLIPPRRWTLVRIGGVMTYDNEHWNFVRDKVRATAWEVHPVFQLWACSRGAACDPRQQDGWIALDDIPEP
jgi:hypothetical protein